MSAHRARSPNSILSCTHIESISIDKSLVRFRVVQHLVEQQNSLLYPIQFFLHLLFVIWFLLRFLIGDRTTRQTVIHSVRLETNPAVPLTAPDMIFISSCAAARSLGEPLRMSSCSFCTGRRDPPQFSGDPAIGLRTHSQLLEPLGLLLQARRVFVDSVVRV